MTGGQIKRGDKLIQIADPRGGFSVVQALDGAAHRWTALEDETANGSVLVDVSPELVYGDGRGVWMRVGQRPN